MGMAFRGRSRAKGNVGIWTGQVTVNGEPTRPSHKVRRGDLVVAFVPTEEASEPVAEAIPLNILYEDNVLLVVDKPAGMVVHPAPGHPGGTLVNALLAHCPDWKNMPCKSVLACKCFNFFINFPEIIPYCRLLINANYPWNHARPWKRLPVCNLFRKPL